MKNAAHAFAASIWCLAAGFFFVDLIGQEELSQDGPSRLPAVLLLPYQFAGKYGILGFFFFISLLVSWVAFEKYRTDDCLFSDDEATSSLLDLLGASLVLAATVGYGFYEGIL